MNDTEKRLLVDPVAKTIVLKYRNQKAIALAKGDKNSVRIIFELPRYIDGYDMSGETNVIQIHYANLSIDKKHQSKGFSVAVSREIEENKLSVAWLVPKTATLYAGVVSVGITVERYETVNGKAEEVYSWSTLPFGKIIVGDSLDNTAEVVERDYDYLVEACNSIVDLALGGKIADVEADIDAMLNDANTKLAEAEMEIDTKLAEARENVDAEVEKVKGYKDAVEAKANEVERYAAQTQGDAKAVATAKADIVTKHSEVLQRAESAKADANSADGFAQEAYNYAYGDDSGYPQYINNSAKYFYEQTKKYAQDYCNAINGTVIGDNAVKIDDISPIATKIDASVEAVNIIDQEKFFKTNQYEIKGEIGKTYIFSCKFKSGANIDDTVVSGIFDFFGNEMSNSNFVAYNDPLPVTITEGHEYKWITENANASDIFESVSMVLADVGNVGIKSYGKNLLDINTEWGTEGSFRTIDIPVPCDVTISYKRKTVQNYYSVMKSNNGLWTSGNRTLVGYLGTPSGTGTGAQPTIQNSLKIPKEDGYEYKLFTNEDILTNNSFDPDKNLEWMQVEVGAASEYEAYKEPAEGVLAVHPTTTLVADTNGVKITAEYKKDINKVIAKLEEAIANS